VRYNFKFDIIKHRKRFFALSAFITLIGILTLFVFGLNFGVDFKAGTSLDITVGKTLDKTKVEQIFKDAGYVPAITTIGGDKSDRVTARFDKVLKLDDVNKIISAMTTAYGVDLSHSHDENTVDIESAKELGKLAIYAVLAACLGIIIYVSIRFEWRFAVAAIIALLHDAFIVVSLFSIFRWEVNLPFVAAVLTIIGYSINDTIVIFDRIRENLRFSKLKNFNDLSELVNRSIWQTMTRSINTILTVLIGAICLFVFGSPAIKYFSLAMIVGLVSGGYSSIFIASPIWLLMKNKSISNNKKLIAAKE
jgi:preprotein translocase subunit SecF